MVVTPATQATLNQTATQTFTNLRVTTPTVANTFVSPTPLNLATPVSGITIAPRSSSVGGGESRPINTPVQAGSTAAALVASGNGVSLSSDSVTVTIPPVSSAADSQRVSTTASVSTANIPTLELPLSGTSAQVSNAAAFVAIAASANFSQAQIETGTSIALTGANYAQVATLIDSISELMVVSASDSLNSTVGEAPGQVLVASALTNQPSFEGTLLAQSKNADPTENITINPSRLNIAIMAFNQIIDSSDDATIIALSKNSDFLAIASLLKQLRMSL
ncbi:MAG: hypothetical protein VKJ27_07505 [Synechocystis sp.]|nr:hypothetical protein [Synechocystis sp.]